MKAIPACKASIYQTEKSENDVAQQAVKKQRKEKQTMKIMSINGGNKWRRKSSSKNDINQWLINKRRNISKQ